VFIDCRKFAPHSGTANPVQETYTIPDAQAIVRGAHGLLMRAANGQSK